LENVCLFVISFMYRHAAYVLLGAVFCYVKTLTHDVSFHVDVHVQLFFGHKYFKEEGGDGGGVSPLINILLTSLFL